MERIEKRLFNLEKDFGSFKDFIATMEKKSETYWGILKSLIGSI